MHKRTLLALAVLIGTVEVVNYAWAQIVSALPFQLQNNTVADATQVMANFNQLLNGINANAAKNGTNSDITQLLGLTTPLAPSVGGTTTWTGGTSTGSANAQVVTPVVPSTFSLVLGTRVVFVAGFTNDAAAGATLNVAGSGVKNIYRNSNVGIGHLIGGEIITGAVIEVVYDGTEYQLVGRYDVVGQVTDWVGAAAPVGWAIADGTCVSQTNYFGVFIAMGSVTGGCGAGLFALPDYSGRYGVGKDNGTGRITTVCAGGNTLGTGCGAQNTSVTVAQVNLPSYTLPNTLGISNTMGVSSTLGISNTMGVSDTRTWATSNSLFPTGGVQGFAAGAVIAVAAAAQSVVTTGGAIALTGGTSLTGGVSLTGGTSITGSVTSGGSGTAITVPTLSPSLVVNKIIKL